ncbi:MAG: GAF domain-containing protein [Thermoguttaceae bacterium]
MSKKESCDELYTQMKNLLGDEPDKIARYANFSALVFKKLSNLNWAGFYFLQDRTLVVGPFQGQPACFRIPAGKGVCGTAVEKRETIIVPNVHEFPGHIACDSDSNSEIVLPLFNTDGMVSGVLDIDSFEFNQFDEDDAIGLRRLTELL